MSEVNSGEKLGEFRYSELAETPSVCPHRQSASIRNLNHPNLGYAVFRCCDCGRKLKSEPARLNFLGFPTLFEIARCRLLCKLSLQNLPQTLCCEDSSSRMKLCGNGIDRDGNLVDAILSATRDMAAA